MAQEDNASAQPSKGDGPESPQQAQRDLLRARFRRADPPRDVIEGRSRGAADGVDFLYERGSLLVREEYYDKVHQILDDLSLLPTADNLQPQSVTAGVRLMYIREDVRPELNTLGLLGLIRDGGAAGSLDETPDKAARDDEGRVLVNGLGSGAVAPNHVVHISGNAGGCPAVEPEPMPAGSAPYPGYTPDRAAGAGVKVVVVDTGFDAAAAQRSSWLNGVTGEPDVAMSGTTLNEYAGHGTFIAGVIRSIAPLAEVYVRSVFNFGGGVLEADLVRALDRVLDEDNPDIISMSAGTYTYDASGLLTFPVFAEKRLSHHKGVAMVVAAGNDADRKPFWPAAAPYTVSVGALDTYWKGRAGFSNFGGWVDVYAPGQDLVNAFPDGTYTYHAPPFLVPPRVEQFYGMARWSGTSFSTPVVSGLIAARMSRTGENGREAAAALIAEAQVAAQRGVGAVLLPE